MCHKRAISTVEQTNLSCTDTAFLDTVTDNKLKGWTLDLIINGKQVPFKLDTGAEVTAISKQTWKTINEPALDKPNEHLFGPAQQQLKVMGHFLCHLSFRDRQAQQQVFVVDNLKTNILGLPAIMAL